MMSHSWKSCCYWCCQSGRAFGGAVDGSNRCGGHWRGFWSHFQMFLDMDRMKMVHSEISSLLGYEKVQFTLEIFISFFAKTREGKILSWGNNKCGQLLLSSGPSKEKVYSSKETMIKGGSTFCIVVNLNNLVYIGSYPPPNTLNMQIQQYWMVLSKKSAVLIITAYRC